MKRFKQISLAALSLLLALGVCGTAAACGGSNDKDKDKTLDYSVTVTCDDSAVLGGIEVELTTAAGLPVEGGAARSLTGGKAVFHAAPGTYHVELSGVPEEDYTWEEATVSEAHPDVTIALTPVEKEQKVSYTITVVDDKDEPVEGAIVQICTVGDTGGSCYGGEETTDAQGKIVIEAPAASYEVHILGGIPQGLIYENEVDGPKNLLTAEKTSITIKLLAPPDGTLANPYLFASPFAGAQTVKLPAYADDEGTAYVYYSYTATETAIYTLTYEDSFIVDVNIAANGDHLHPIALWNIKAESYPFQLKAGTTYSFRFADFRAQAVGGDLPITITETELSIPDSYAGTWTDVPEAEGPVHTVVLTKTDGAWTVTYNGTKIELGLADTNGGYLFTLGGKDYTMSFPENGASLLLAWGNGEDESVFLFTEGNHPDRSPGTQGNPIPLTQDDLTTRTWSENTTVEGKFFTVTVTETKMYQLTVTAVSAENCEAMISIEDETGHNVLSEWMGAVDATVNFRLDEGKTYTINVGVADPTDETGMTSPSGTVAFTLEEVTLTEIPQEILDIEWVSDAAKIALTKYTVTLTTFFPLTGDVTAVSTEDGKTTIVWGTGGYTLVYDAAAQTLTATMGSNTYTFTAKEEGGTITLPEGWNGTYQRDGYKVVIDGTNIKISFGTYTDVTVTVTGYDEASGTISFTADGITGSIQKTQSWEDPADNISNVSLTVNGETQRNLPKQA